MGFARGVGVALAAWVGMASAAWADPTQEQLNRITADRKRHDAAVEAGRRQAGFCFNCHGEHGISIQAEIPNLAGQPASYLVEQIRRFGDGRRRDAFMQGLIKALSDDEKLNIALYYAAQPLRPSAGGAGNPELGKPIYVRLCQNCHGETGRGNLATPTLAGQQYAYLVKSTQRYRDRTGERQHKEMSEAVARMSDPDIANVSAYLNRLR
jgi:cytochrome c553